MTPEEAQAKYIELLPKCKCFTRAGIDGAGLMDFTIINEVSTFVGLIEQQMSPLCPPARIYYAGTLIVALLSAIATPKEARKAEYSSEEIKDQRYALITLLEEISDTIKARLEVIAVINEG